MQKNTDKPTEEWEKRYGPCAKGTALRIIVLGKRVGRAWLAARASTIRAGRPERKE
jgi:hypothetical protein